MKTISILLTLLTTALSASTQNPLTLPAGSALDGSIYELESTWYDQEGNPITLENLAGKVRIVAMGYTSCMYACPRIIADLKSIEEKLTDDERNSGQLSFSFISIDPENDTPERMKQLESDHEFDPRNWLLLTGDEDGVLELAVALGMKYRKTSAMDFAHSNIITVLAPDGRIAYQTSAIGEDIAKTVAAIRTNLDAINK